MHPVWAMREWLDALEARTKKFSVGIVVLGNQLESAVLPRTVIWQLVDAGTSVGCNHRAVRRARSDRELVSKLAVVVEEADETAFWLEVVSEVLAPERLPAPVGALLEEAKELRAIFSRSRKTAAERLKLKKSRKRKAQQLTHPAPGS